METSLIGKALNFGFNDYGFESRVSNMSYNYKFSYIINLIKINKAKQRLYFDILFTKQTLMYSNIFNSLNYIFRYEIIIKNNKHLIRLYINYQNSKNVGNGFKLFSKPSHSFRISLKALKLITKKTGDSVFLISNSYGILSHNDAIKKNSAGLLLCFFNI